MNIRYFQLGDPLGFPEVFDGIIVGDNNLSTYNKFTFACRNRPKTKQSFWHIIVYENRSPSYMFNDKMSTKESMIEFIRENHPADFEWLLWNPEVLGGDVSKFKD